MELVFENGQFLAKSQRPNPQNQRTKSIVDLYEDEYNEDFKKSIHGADKVVPEHHAVVVAAYGTNMLMNQLTLIQTLKACSSKRMVVDYENQKEIMFIPPDEQSVVAGRSVELSFDSTDLPEDSEGSTYLSSSLDGESDGVAARTRKALVKRRRNRELYDSSEKKQRKDIKKKMRTLQDLLPNSDKDDSESTTLDVAINYMTTLQHQIEMMTMSNGYVAPAMMLPLGAQYYSQIGLPTCMQMSGAPQFLPPPALGADMHPGLVMQMQNSAFFNPAEYYFPQSVPPSCAAFPYQIQNSTTLSNLWNRQ